MSFIVLPRALDKKKSSPPTFGVRAQTLHYYKYNISY